MPVRVGGFDSGRNLEQASLLAEGSDELQTSWQAVVGESGRD